MKKRVNHEIIEEGSNQIVKAMNDQVYPEVTETCVQTNGMRTERNTNT